MNKQLSKSLLCLTALLTPVSAFANGAPEQQAAPMEAAEPAKKEKLFYLTGSLAFTTDYLFRGQTQTFGRPAVQGGMEVSQYEDRGLLAGIWGSNISAAEFANSDGLEFDAYLGYKYKHNDDLSMKLLAYWYLYPGAKFGPNANGRSDNYNAMEIIPSVSWKWFTATFAYSVTDKSGFNSTFAPFGPQGQLAANGGSSGSWYLEGAARFPLFDSGFALNLVYGYQDVKNYGKFSFSNYGASIDYTTPEDWYALNLKVGVSSTDNNETYYTVTNGRGKRRDIGRTVGYFTLSKSF